MCGTCFMHCFERRYQKSRSFCNMASFKLSFSWGQVKIISMKIAFRNEKRWIKRAYDAMFPQELSYSTAVSYVVFHSIKSQFKKVTSFYGICLSRFLLKNGGIALAFTLESLKRQIVHRHAVLCFSACSVHRYAVIRPAPFIK